MFIICFTPLALNNVAEVADNYEEYAVGDTQPICSEQEVVDFIDIEEIEEIEEIEDIIEVIVLPVVLNTGDLFALSNATVEELNYAFKGTALEGIGSTLVLGEENGGINAFVLGAITAYESAWGKSRRAREDGNYTGLGVGTPSSKGIIFSGQDKFASVLYAGDLISTKYITPGGKFYVGSRQLSDVARTYCPPTHKQWTADVTSIANKLKNKVIYYREEIANK